MTNYYSVTVRITFGVLADSAEEADKIAESLVPADDIPAEAYSARDVYLTPNQDESLKRHAVNY